MCLRGHNKEGMMTVSVPRSCHIRVTKNKGTLGFYFLSYLKHIKDMESKSIWEVTSTYRNPCTTPTGHTKDNMVYLCSQNLLPSFMKCNTKFLEKCKRSLMFGSAHIQLIAYKWHQNFADTHIQRHYNQMSVTWNQQINHRPLTDLWHQDAP